jgi:opacity protein-like surface antigen
MKKLLMFMLVAAIPCAAQWRRFGEPEIRPTGYFGLGVSTPVNPVATRLNHGWNLAGGAGLTSRYVGVLADVMYNDFGFTRGALLEAGARRGRQRYWGISANPIVHVNPRGPVDFYLTGGVGIYGQITQYRTSSGDGRFADRYDLIASDQINRPGVNLGAGFAFHLGREGDPKIFVEARYHHMFTAGSGSSMVPVTVGVRF